MMSNCFDEGTMQAFLDGELDAATVDSVVQHTAVCNTCAILLSESEQEAEFAFSALEQEFDTLVPTHRLWTKINASIEEDTRGQSIWQRVFAGISGFGFSMPTVAAFASLLIVFGLFVALFSLKPDNSGGEFIAKKIELKQENTVVTSNPAPANLPEREETPVIAAEEKENEFVSETPQIVKARFNKADIPNKNRPAAVRTEERRAQIENSSANTVSAPAYLPGEESYVKTIETLSETVDSRKDVALKPSVRIAFESDMAVIDDAIQKMKAEVKKNPSNKAAKRVLYASYQNKIDLLNSVSEKTELMASLR